MYINFQLEKVSIGNGLASFFVTINPDYTSQDGILGLEALLSLGR
jgi:L,D-peptidoglycan transpeptidase YkuD (ErfK/YbiS/YcfS/YnhG family)